MKKVAVGLLILFAIFICLFVLVNKITDKGISVENNNTNIFQAEISTNAVSCEKIKVVNSVKDLFPNLPYDATIVSVNGNLMQKSDVLREAKTFMSLVMNKRRQKKIGKRELGLFRARCRTAADRFVLKNLVLEYAKQNNVMVDEKAVSNVTRMIEYQYGVRSRKLNRWHRLADLKYMLGKNSKILDNEVKFAALYQSVTNHIITSKAFAVTDMMVSNRIADITAYNMRAQATNELVFAKATNIWEQILSKKLNFEEAARKYSEDAYISEGIEWGNFTRELLSGEEELLKLLPEMKNGDITPPIASDGGVGIVRLDEIDQQGQYCFSRVFLRLPLYYEVETPDEAASAIRSQTEAKLIKETFDNYKHKMDIQYPCGTNLFEKIEKDFKVTEKDLSL